MWVYLGLLIIAIICLFHSNIDKSQKRIWGIFLSFFLILVSGLRYNVGMDYLAYEEIYNEISNGLTADTEWGYAIVCKLCSAAGGKAQLMFLLLSIITITLFYKAYRLFSPDIVMSLVIFMSLGQLYITTFNAVRQCVAVGIFSIAVYYVIKKDFFKYTILIGIGTLFHTTALVLLPLYFVLKTRLTRKIKIIIFILLSFSSHIIFEIILNSPYAVYLKFENFASEASIVNYLYLLLGIFLVLLEPKLMTKYADRHIFFNINMICTCLFVLFFVFSGTPITMVVIRLNYYFICFYAIIFARIICDIKRPANRRCVELILYVILFAMYIRTTLLLGESYNLIPYRINIELF